jgi:proteasome accessory factor C
MSAQDRLGRLLFIVPYVLHRDGVPVSELAALLNVPRAKLEADLLLLSLVGRPPLTPDHLIDIYVEDDVVYVELAQSLTRPLRLSRSELRALVLAVKGVGDLGGLGDSLAALVERVAERLAPEDAAEVRALWTGVHVAGSGSEIPARLQGAIAEHRQVRLDYYSATSDRSKTYSLSPLALLNHMGNEYLLALEEGREKLFRVDRMSELALMEERFVPPADLDLERFRRQQLVASVGLEARVWFAPAVRRLVRERFAEDRVRDAPDGGVYVQMETSSPVWISRWVLPFGVDAELLGPTEERTRLAALCRAAVAAYDQAGGGSQTPR